MRDLVGQQNATVQIPSFEPPRLKKRQTDCGDDENRGGVDDVVNAASRGDELASCLGPFRI